MKRTRLALLQRAIATVIVILSVAMISATGRPSVLNQALAGRTLPKEFDAPAPVRHIIERACLDCHSDQTVWPWYSYIPPISWEIHGDVDRARAFMDLSNWNNYTLAERSTFASQMAGMARARVMPPSRYLWIHRDAKLSDADVAALTEWVRTAAK
jgi:hypothetical protein